MATPISAGLKAALSSGKQIPITKIEVLDAASRVTLKTITEVDEGTVTVDVSRGTRRTFQIRLSNKDGLFTPLSSSDDFYFNRLIRIYRGLEFVDSTNQIVDEYVCLGTFMVDRPEVFTERNMSVLTVDGSDLWKKIATGGFASGHSFPIGTHINDIISLVASLSGVGLNNIALNPYPTRTTAGYLTGTVVAWETGDSRSDFLQNLATQWGIQIFFTVNGFLTTAEIPNLSIASPVWTFTVGETSTMLGVSKILNDLKLVNHIVVIGETAGAAPTVRVELADTDVSSPTSIYGPLGNRVLVYRGPEITTVEQATTVAQKLYAENALIEEQLRLPIVALPHLEGNDVIRVIEPTFSRISSTYFAQRFDIPLRESRMTIDTKRARAY